MAKRIAGIASLLVFSACLLTGAFDAENSFFTAVWRALQAMGGTLIIGLVIGWMAQKMVAENVSQVVAAANTPPLAEENLTKINAPNKPAVKK